MKKWAFISLVCIPLLSGAQLPAEDLELVLRSESQREASEMNWHSPHFSLSLNPLKLTGRALMYLYQQEITYQLHSDCMYHQSCSEFTRRAVEHFGVLKGTALGFDRLSRCNGLEHIELGEERIQNGKFEDPLEDYISGK